MIVLIKTILTFFSNLLDVSFVILPILLIAALFNLKIFRKTPALQFFLLTSAIFLGWRALFCFYNGGGISDRYIAVLPLVFSVIAVAGIPVLSGWLVKLLAMRNIHVRESKVVLFLLLLASAICLGKALNPPDRKPYIPAIANYLKSNAPANSLLIDCTADGERIVFYGDLNVVARGVRKYTRDKAMFFQEFKKVMSEQHDPARRIYLVVRIDDQEEFIASCNKELGGFSFILRYSCKIKKDIVLLYEKNPVMENK